MTLTDIGARMQRGLDRHPLDQSLKFDCGTEGQIHLAEGVVRYADDPADCTITISRRNLEKLIAGQLNPMTAFAMGRIKVSGDMSLALKLGQMLKG